MKDTLAATTWGSIATGAAEKMQEKLITKNCESYISKVKMKMEELEVEPPPALLKFEH